MSNYIHITEEQTLAANQIDLVCFLQSHGEKLIKSGREMRLESNHSITISGNHWYDHATEQGGYPIDFVKQHYGVRFPEAVSMLLGGGVNVAMVEQSPPKKIEPKPFYLPNKHDNPRRVYAYLINTRGIDPDVVRHCFKTHLLYESSEQKKGWAKPIHNAIFVGRDEHGTPRHAHQHGLHTEEKTFKGNVTGSQPQYSFHHLGTSDKLLVFEAPIDLLAYVTLHPENWQDHSYVALCGVGSQALAWMLEQNQQLRSVSLCLDNDGAGEQACTKLRTSLEEQGYDVTRECPTYKDWGDDVLAIKAQVQEFERGGDPQMQFGMSMSMG